MFCVWMWIWTVRGPKPDIPVAGGELAASRRYPRGTHVGTDCYLIRHRVLSALIASLMQRVQPLGAMPCT
jgi:hypothetical protein